MSLHNGNGGWSRIEFFGVFRPSPSFHFHLLQFTAFAYLAYRFASREYYLYGFLPSAAFDYGHGFIMELTQFLFIDLVTFQWLHFFLPRPGPQSLLVLQCAVIFACVAGACGVRPRVMAWIGLLLGLYFAGMMHVTDSETDGETVVLCAMAILAMSPGHAFFDVFRRKPSMARSQDYHWPIFLLFVVVGSFYTLAGLHKLVDVGPQWPFLLNLDGYTTFMRERAVFTSSRYVLTSLPDLFSTPWFSVLGAMVTLLAEAGLLAALFLPRLRFLLVTTLGVFHVLVFFSTGINFVGSFFIVLMLLDWNALARKVAIQVSPGCAWCHDLAAAVAAADRFVRVTSVEVSLTSRRCEGGVCGVRLVEEGGNSREGSDALELLFHKCPKWYPLAVALKMPLLSGILRRRPELLAKLAFR